jgi:hypothetical protein
MSDHPIIFSAPMVRALLDGRKTMTRRLAWRPAKTMMIECEHGFDTCPTCDAAKPSPWQRVKPGDRLWVRETLVPSSCGFEYAAPGDDDNIDLSDLTDDQVDFWNRRAGDDPDNSPKVSPIYMPRWASRLTLVITATKIERLHDINVSDALAEGIFKWPKRSIAGEPLWHFIPPATKIEDIHLGCTSPVNAFAWLWQSIHSKESWDANHEVVALAFTIHQQNIDVMPKAAAA